MDALEQTRISGVDAMGAALAHELNQPLAAMMIYLQSLQRQVQRSPVAIDPILRELADKSLREAERASEIVRRMRRFTSRSEPDRQMVDINAVAEESIEVALAGISRPPLVERRLMANLPPVACDASQVRQVMVNLLRNAVDATGNRPRPQVTVTTLTADGLVHFNVEDNGPGVDPRIVGRLFKAFETSKPQGMGLGLAISRMIAQNHGGDLVLESGGTGNGACFGLRLPLR
ncbi:MAG: sensor histidine kinase [Bosea sp. (in: a-proteobacteria)]